MPVPHRPQKYAVPVLRSRAAQVVFSPGFAFCLFTLVLWGTHSPGIYDAAARNQALHDLEHLSYLVSALLLWSVIFGFDFGPAPRPPGTAAADVLRDGARAILGLVLTSTPHALYPYYADAAQEIGISAVKDQHLGGVIMWLGGMVVIVTMMVPVLLSWLAEDERRTVQREARAAEHAGSAGG